MSYHYYAVKYTRAPDQVRIEKADTPTRAFKLAFGVKPYIARGGEPTRCEWKDLGTRSVAIQSDARRVAMITARDGWDRFQASRRSHNTTGESSWRT